MIFETYSGDEETGTDEEVHTAGKEETDKDEKVGHAEIEEPSGQTYRRGRRWEEIDSSKEDYADKKESEKYEYLPEVTLSASDKNDHVESSTPVLKQWSYSGRVLPSAVANTLCCELGVVGILETLNAPVRTLGSPLYRACKYFLAQDYDLGTAYAHLRRHPDDFDIDRHVTDTRKSDKQMREGLLEKGNIDKHASPRHIWDLHANRVVPYWVANEHPWAISHAWVMDKDLKREMTPINGYEWPVPMPKDADLDLIRIEMLNLGVEYVWLDVLCLRQAGRGEDPWGHIGKRKWRHREAVRKEEWKVDVPTIGWVYAQAGSRVICYFSGLGLPLSFKTADDFEDDRCWFNRAWTLQETPQKPIIAGETCGNGGVDERFITDHMQSRVDDQLESLGEMQRRREAGASIFVFLSHMQKRKSTKTVDKVATLVYLFHSKHIPIYDAGQSEEEAWTELANVSVGWFRGELFFLYPKAGSGTKVWRPSWRQVMEETLPDSQHISGPLFSEVDWTEKDGDSYDGPHIDTCRVRGLANTSGNPRYGELYVKNGSGVEHSFKIVADHACPIDDGRYTLIGGIAASESLDRLLEMFWVVGKIEEPEGNFRKVSMFRMADDEDVETLMDLDVYKQTTTFLV